MLKLNPKIMGIAVALCMLPLAAFADPTGGWRGSVTKGNESYPVEAVFTSRKVEVHFGGTAACALKADYVKPDGRDLLYTFGVSTNGGPLCDRLYGQMLEVRYTDGDDHMTISFNAGGKWSGDLQRDNPSS